MVIERPIEGFHGWGDEARKPLSRGALFTIGAVALVHVAGAAYLYYMRISAPAIQSPPEPPAILVDTVRTKTPPPPKTTPPPPRVIQFHPPVATTITPPETIQVPIPPKQLTPPRIDTPPLIDLTARTTPPPPPPPPADKVIRNPTWLARPTPAQLAAFYPPRALDDEIDGQAVLDCRVTANGQLTACTTSGETPAGYGFASAALKASRIFRMTPRTEDGQPVEGGLVHIPMRFSTH